MGYEKNWFRRRQQRHWLRHLGHLASTPIRYLEIGVLEGKSLCWVMENIACHPESRAMGIDLWQGQIEGWPGKDASELIEVANVNVAKYGSRVILECVASCEFLGLEVACVRDGTYIGYDLIFIDGSHDPVDVLADSAMCWKLLPPGGYLIWDDYNARPRPAIQAFLQVLESPTAGDLTPVVLPVHYSVVFDSGQQLCIRKSDV